MRKRPARFLLAAAVMLPSALSGCLQGAIDANKRQLDQQQTQLDELKQQVAALQNQRAYSTTPPPPGACDNAVMTTATRKGGDRFAAGDFAHALGYYQDAATACPSSAQAQLNVARTFEAVGDRAQATAHYRLAAGAGGVGATDAAAVKQARDALSRLGGKS
jgi:outer membrane murein-binding lipoprotein Lpp